MIFGANHIRQEPLLINGYSSGYLGYKNARFGSVETHVILTAWGRKTLLTAKDIAEELGFDVLHMYVDGLWVKRDNFNKPEHPQDLLEIITKETGVSICLEGSTSGSCFYLQNEIPTCLSQIATLKSSKMERSRREA